MTEQQFIIRKGGYYYRPNAQGYTSSLLEAGRYPETEAMAHMEHCDPGEITIFPAPAVPASPTLPQDIAATAERIVLEHIAAGLDIDGSSAGTRLDMLAVAIATALEIERAAAPPLHQMVGSAKPIAHLIWLQFAGNKGNVADYYEVARPGDHSADGSEPFPVYASPPTSGGQSFSNVARSETAAELISDWLSEGVEDLPDETEVTIQIGKRTTIRERLAGLRAVVDPAPRVSSPTRAEETVVSKDIVPMLDRIMGLQTTIIEEVTSLGAKTLSMRFDTAKDALVFVKTFQEIKGWADKFRNTRSLEGEVAEPLIWQVSSEGEWLLTEDPDHWISMGRKVRPLYTTPVGATVSSNENIPATTKKHRYQKFDVEGEQSANRQETPKQLLVGVETIECVSYEKGYEEETDPIYRIEIDGYCVDFEHRVAADNFANAINARIRAALFAEVAE